MALRAFFRKMREIESTITPDYVVVVSNETTDGGRPGVQTEVSRNQAARLVAGGQARIATPEETASYYQDLSERWRKANLPETTGSDVASAADQTKR